MKVLLATSLILAFAASAAYACCDTCTCWEKCFDNPRDDKEKEYYAYFHQVVQAVRGLRLTHNIVGTAYLLDSTVTDAAEWQYEKDLARLLVLTQPAGQSCNPLFFARFLNFNPNSAMAWAYFYWNCQETCQASQLLLTSSGFSDFGLIPGLSQPNEPADWTWGGGIIGEWLTNRCLARSWDYLVPCKQEASGKRMAVALHNSNTAPFGMTPNTFAVRVSININAGLFHSAWPFPANTNPAVTVQETYNSAAAQSYLRNLLSCIELDCCRDKKYSGNRQDDGEDFALVSQSGTADDEPKIVTSYELQKIINNGIQGNGGEGDSKTKA